MNLGLSHTGRVCYHYTTVPGRATPECVPANSSEFGLKLEEKITDFFDLTTPGKSHSEKDHSIQVKKISSILRKEKIATFVSGRKFKGPKMVSNFFDSFDEASFRSWHFKKDRELNRYSARSRSNNLH